jgi:hypothetical protein
MVLIAALKRMPVAEREKDLFELFGSERPAQHIRFFLGRDGPGV